MSDNLPVTEGEYYIALAVYHVTGIYYAPCEAAESEYEVALRIYTAVVLRTPAGGRSRALDHF
jgi:hypothetical protein